MLATAVADHKPPAMFGKSVMRRYCLAPLLFLCAAAPVAAQTDQTIDRRVAKIEKELRAVQRKVFPGGAGMTVEPEIGQVDATAAAGPPGAPASNAVADLTGRVDALEAQLRTLTGQAEVNAHRLAELEQAFAQLKASMDSRAAASKPAASPSAAPAPAAALPPAPADPPRDQAPPAASGSADPGETAYLAGYRQWNDGQYAEAQKTLEAMVKQYPKHPRASFAQNLLGRAYLDGGKPATAAKVLLANYQNGPKGERAPDSLYFLGLALIKLNKKPEACRVYEELQDVYGASMRSWVKERLPKARQDAGCS